MNGFCVGKRRFLSMNNYVWYKLLYFKSVSQFSSFRVCFCIMCCLERLCRIVFSIIFTVSVFDSEWCVTVSSSPLSLCPPSSPSLCPSLSPLCHCVPLSLPSFTVSSPPSLCPPPLPSVTVSPSPPSLCPSPPPLRRCVPLPSSPLRDDEVLPVRSHRIVAAPAPVDTTTTEEAVSVRICV